MKTALARALRAASLVGALACGGGDSAEKKLFLQQKSVCEGLVAAGRTQRQGVNDLGTLRPIVGVFAGPGLCKTNLLRLPSSKTDHCTYPGTVCQTTLEWLAGDQDLCSSNGCTYFCEMRTMASDPAGPPDAATGLTDAQICGVDWESGQSGL